jgi:hypothetical protein
VLVLVVVGVRLSQQVEKSRAEQTKLNRQLATVSQNLKGLQSNDLKPDLISRLERLKSTPEPQALPSRQQALELGPALVIYAAVQGLQLNTFDTVQTSPPAASPATGSPSPPAGSLPEKAERPTINYSVVARGRMDSLVGALQLMGGFPTARVQKLEFTRAPGGQPLWEMNLDLAVFYGN